MEYLQDLPDSRVMMGTKGLAPGSLTGANQRKQG
jgi:hypothetical protein